MKGLRFIVMSLFLLFGITFSFAQKETNIWYFGSFAGLDFNSDSPSALVDGKFSSFNSSASIADENGNLMFYTNGVTVWNKIHQVMQNSTTPVYTDYGYVWSPVIYTQEHYPLIIPKPDTPMIYFLLTSSYPEGFSYSEIDMSLDNGLGAITKKDLVLDSSMYAPISATKHANGSDIWLVLFDQKNNVFKSYLVTEFGINTTPVISNTCSNLVCGGLKFSPSGSSFATVCTNGVYLYDFNRVSGAITNPITINSRTGITAIEFSPSESILYACYSSSFDINPDYSNYRDVMYQYDLMSLDIMGSEFEIYSIKLPVDFNYHYDLLLAPDNKIYVDIDKYEYLGVIQAPDNWGTSCNYIQNGIWLGGKYSLERLPNFMNFSAPQMDPGIYVASNCQSSAIPFYYVGSEGYDTLLWDFGDGSTSVEKNPLHFYANEGNYNVTLTLNDAIQQKTYTKVVTIVDSPVATKPSDMVVCDQSGFYVFDLTTKDSTILNGLNPTKFEITYYASLDDYYHCLPIPDPQNHMNSTAFGTETIIASVRNNYSYDCEDITDFNITVSDGLSINHSIPKLAICDNQSIGTDVDALIQVDLTQYEPVILNEQSSSDFEVRYFKDASMQNEILSPYQYVNSDPIETIYVQVLSNLSTPCLDDTSFELEVLKLPKTMSPVELKQCDDDLDGFSPFNLNEVINEITTNAANETITFHESEGDAENGIDAITNTTAYLNGTVSSDMVWARVENENECFRTSQVNLTVTTTQIPDSFTREFHICDDDVEGDTIDGISSFDFSNVGSEIEALFPVGQDLVIAYYRNETDALAESNPIEDITNYRNTGYPNFQQIYVRVDSRIDNDCIGLGAHIKLYVETMPVAHPVIMERQCDDDHDGMFLFDTAQVESQVRNGQPLSDFKVAYFDNNNNPLPSPLPNPFLTKNQTITVRITNNRVGDGSCYDETTFDFIVDVLPIAYPVQAQIACDDGPDDSNGFNAFDTSLIESILLNGQTGMEVHYYTPNGEELPSPLPNPFTTDTQTLIAEVINPLNTTCTATTEISFTVNPLPEFDIETPQIVCSSDPTFTVLLDPEEIDVSETYTYEWVYEDGTVLSNAPVLTVATPGTYSVTLSKTDGTGCSRTREIFVNASELSTITSKDVSIVQLTDNNSITIDYSNNNLGLGDYEFALDHISGAYQDNPYFDHISSGKHILYVRDKKGCGIAQLEVFIMGFPKFFTPNDDGYNDTWNIEGLSYEYSLDSKVYIFDRYGKLLKELNPRGAGWNGFFQGEKLRSSDYWFLAELYGVDGTLTTYKGHFSLVR